jgi:hypothetical protein
MKKIFLLTLLISSISYADLDIGEDFEAGDLVTAAAFNDKFNSLSGVVGEIVDADLIGNWQCTSYKDNRDLSHTSENGGNGQVGNGYFYSNSGLLSLSQNDDEKSLNTPKLWSIDRDDVLFDGEFVENQAFLNQGTYILLGNTLNFYSSPSNATGDLNYYGAFNIKMLSEIKIYLTTTPGSVYLGFPNPNVICDKVQT